MFRHASRSTPGSVERAGGRQPRPRASSGTTPRVSHDVSSLDVVAEREADAVASHAVGEPVRFAAPRTGPPLDQGRVAGALGVGKPLDAHDRQFFRDRFDATLAGDAAESVDAVRVYTDERAAALAEAAGAQAVTIGHDLAFARGQYRPGPGPGRALLSHEVAHAVMHHDTRRVHRAARYSTGERAAMSTGAVTGGSLDTAIAAERSFRPGDIVFRMGSSSLGAIIGEPVTHGGIYLGDGLIHDMVGFGNRTVRVSDFYLEADDPSVVRVVRFTGPHAGLITPRLLANVAARNFRLPTDPLPWNLFSSATDYRTATCLEYSHAQFLHAINELVADPAVAGPVQTALRSEYFAAGAGSASDLISPTAISQSGTPSAPPGIVVSGLIGAADYLAEDVDPTVFSNRWEGTTTTTNYGPSWWPNLVMTATLQTFTYRSFVNATRYFTDVPVPTISAATPSSALVRDVHAATGDSDLRAFIAGHSTSELGSLPTAEKARMIDRLLSGWVADADVAAVETLCGSVTSSAEMRTLEARSRAAVDAMTSDAQQTRVRNALRRRP